MATGGTQLRHDVDDDAVYVWQSTIWYVGDYLKKAAPGYSTRIGAVRLPGCAGR